MMSCVTPIAIETTLPMYDVIVIGAGAAGIAVARQLGAAGLDVALVEGGGLELSPDSQALYAGQVDGLPYNVGGSRLRYFGGTTNHWVGLCRPLDPATFIAQPAMDYPGWDIPRDDLMPYLAGALDILDIDADVPWWPPNTASSLHAQLAAHSLEEVYWHWSPPTRFRDKYLSDLQATPNIDVRLHESLVDLEFDADGTITGAVFHHFPSGERRTLHGHQFVLACGGIENARLLLHINRQHDVTFGGPMLGQYFMEHLHVDEAGTLVMLDSAYLHSTVGTNNVRFFKPTAEASAEQNLLQCVVRVFALEMDSEQRVFAERLAALTRLPDSHTWRVFALGMVSEQAPRADNAVILDETTDALGMPHTRLRWTASDRDINTLRWTAMRFGEFVARTNLGRCRFEPWVFDTARPVVPTGGAHHMGTTRLAGDPSRGVVDTDCRLYGTRNLYVAGSSVFPTGGHANPTLTIVQLALRLADHLATRAASLPDH